MSHPSEDDVAKANEAGVIPDAPTYNPVQVKRITSARRDFWFGMGLALVLFVVFIVFPAGYTVHLIREDRANRRPTKIAEDLVSEFVYVRRAASGRYSDVTQRDVAVQIYTLLIEKSRQARDLTEQDREVLIASLAESPPHYKYLDAEAQATLLGQELLAVKSVAQAEMLLDVLATVDLIKEPATTKVICDFIRDPHQRAFSYYSKSGLIWRLLLRMGFSSKAFEVGNNTDLFQKLAPAQAQTLADALTEYLANTATSDAEALVIHRDQAGGVTSNLAGAAGESLSSDEITSSIKKVIEHLKNPMEVQLQYDFDLDVPDTLEPEPAGAK